MAEETQVFTLNKGESTSWERPVTRIFVANGVLAVNDGDKSKTLKEGGEYRAESSTVVSVSAIEGSNFAVDFPAAVPPPVTLQPEKVDTTGADKKRKGKKK